MCPVCHPSANQRLRVLPQSHPFNAWITVFPASCSTSARARTQLIQTECAANAWYQLFIKMTWDKLAVFFLQLSWTVQHVTAIHRHDIYPYGMFYGDVALQEGDDETSKVITLTKPMYFYEASFNNLYVSTLLLLLLCLYLP